MGEAFPIPEAVLSWLNVRLRDADQPVDLRTLHMTEDGACRVTGTVKKFGMTADVELRFLLGGEDGKLQVREVEIDTTNALARPFLSQVRSLLIAKGREVLAPHGIEILEE